jgi:hypothetical protein
VIGEGSADEVTPANHRTDGRVELGWPGRVVILIPCLPSLSERERRRSRGGHTIHRLAGECPMSGGAFATVLVAAPIKGVWEADGVGSIICQDHYSIAGGGVVFEEMVARCGTREQHFCARGLSCLLKKLIEAAGRREGVGLASSRVACRRRSPARACSTSRGARMQG